MKLVKAVYDALDALAYSRNWTDFSFDHAAEPDGPADSQSVNGPAR